MSPTSRGRKKKRSTTRPRSARRVLPGPDSVHAELLGTFRPAVQATGPLEVEVLTSGVLGCICQVSRLTELGPAGSR